MLDDTSGDGLSVQMTMLQWHCIDGSTDNAVTSAIDDFRDDLVEAGTAIREAGWHQVAGMTPGVPGSGRWPPYETLVTVTMSRSLWSLIVHIVDYWESVHERVHPEGDHELWLELREIITTALDGTLTPWRMS